MVSLLQRLEWRVGALVVLAVAPMAFAQPILEPHRFEATFDHGSVGSWSSYPPAQDTAYDPTIWVRPLAGDPSADNRALYRELTPHYPNDIEFGVRKRLDLVVDASSRLRFRAWVQAADGTDGVKVRFAFSDGTDWSSTVVVSETRRWVDAEASLGELVDSGAHVAEITRPAATLRIQNVAPSESEWESRRRRQ